MKILMSISIICLLQMNMGFANPFKDLANQFKKIGESGGIRTMNGYLSKKAVQQTINEYEQFVTDPKRIKKTSLAKLTKKIDAMTTIEFNEFYKNERNTHLISGKFKVIDVEKVKSFPSYMDIPSDEQQLRKWRKVHPVDLYQYSHIVSLRMASKKNSSSILGPNYQFFIRPKDKAILSKLRKGKLVSVKAVLSGLSEKEVLTSRVFYLGVRKISLR